MKHRISLYLTYAAIVLFGTVGILLLLFGEKQQRESETENRMLAGFPTLSFETLRDGSFMAGLETYLSDGMPARDRIVTDTAVWMHAFSLQKQEQAEDELYEAVEALGEEAEEDAIEVPAETLPTPAPTQEPTDVPNETAALPADETEPSAEPAASSTAPTEAATEAPQPTAEPPAAPVEACTFRQMRADGTDRTTYTFSKQNMQNAIDVLNAYRAVLPEDGHLFFTQIPFPSLARSLQNGEYVHSLYSTDMQLVLRSLKDAGYANGVYILRCKDLHMTRRVQMR